MSKKYRETTPESITDDILTFARDLGAAAPAFVPIAVPPDALKGNCFQNVERQRRLLGGTALFGRLIRSADDLYLAADFHCVVSAPQGLVDVTPPESGEKRTLFAPYPDLDATDDAMTIFRPTQLQSLLSASTGAHEASARKNGVTVRQLLLSKLPRDPLAAQIDDYLRAEGKVEAMIVAAHDGSRGWNPSQLEGLKDEYRRLDRRRDELHEAADRRSGFG
jgi:hypothetical protein